MPDPAVITAVAVCCHCDEPIYTEDDVSQRWLGETVCLRCGYEALALPDRLPGESGSHYEAVVLAQRAKYRELAKAGAL